MSKKSAEYWRKRFGQMEKVTNKKSQKKAEEIGEQFDRSLSEISKKITIWYQRLADNNGVSLAEAKKMLDADELKEFRWSVEEYIKYGRENSENQQWVKELENASAKVHIRQLEALQYEIRGEAEKLYTKYLDKANDHIKNAYTDEYYRTAYEIQKGQEFFSNIRKLDKRVVEKILNTPWAVDEKNFSERIWQDKTKLINTLYQSLSKMCLTGASPEAAVGEISKAMKASRAQARRLVMTESAAFSNKARQENMKELGVQEFEILETLDSHTCSMCGTMDKKHYPLKDFEIGVTAPPFHPQCRGNTIPYFEDEYTEGEERAARGEDGKTYYVSADLSYQEWEKKYVMPEGKSKRIDLGKVLMERLDEAIAYFEEQIRDEDLENAVVVENDGQVVQFVGEKDNVDIYDVNMEKAIITHNHPADQGDVSFGKDDFSFLQDHPEIKEFRCVSNAYNYKIRVLKPLDKISYNTLYREGLEDISAGGELNHCICCVLKKKGYIEYERTKIDRRTDR
ncbi:MAG: minor capsid protein [Eubacterium sp.]|nr:minor capsid protein [Eubacterium sp.]